MARSPLTETIYRVQGMITYVRENLSTDEFMLFLDLLLPEPVEPVKPAKKKRKPRAAKSQRAASLAEQLKATGKVKDDSDPSAHCQKTFPGGFVCDEPADANVHHLRGGTGYHEFEAGAHNMVAEAGAGIQAVDIGPLP